MIIQGRRPLAGLTNQNQAALADWLFTWRNLANSADISCTGVLVPLSGSLKHSSDLKMIKNNRGDEVTVFATNEKIIIEAVCVPLGATPADTSSVDALANVITAAYIPPPAAFLQISNAPAINLGTFADAFNATNWNYNGDGDLVFASDGEWGIRFSATRRVNMIRSAAIQL